ncbi:sugar transporter, partial [Salmonella enterica]|nr:sugar transporter [Salmonella enterica]EKT1605677.1 sugar transporter [Salmonella enterica]
MDSFKDVMARDISAAFLNVKEFADTYNIDGKNVLAVLDTDLVHERNKRSYAEFTEGVNQGQITLFVSRDDFTHLPVKDQLMV